MVRWVNGACLAMWAAGLIGAFACVLVVVGGHDRAMTTFALLTLVALVLALGITVGQALIEGVKTGGK